MKMYGELASWWSVLRPHGGFEDQAIWILGLSEALAKRPLRSVLELGSAAGLLASELPDSLEVVLLDQSEAMLQESRRLNASREHVCADLREARLGRTFDLVVLHDAVMYMRSEADLAAALATCAAHVKRHGVVVVMPDLVRENFQERTLYGSGASVDGRIAHLTEWHWDPDPADSTIRVEFCAVLRDADGAVQVVHEAHEQGVFDRPTWLRLVEQAGFSLHWADLPPELGLGECFLLRPARA